MLLKNMDPNNPVTITKSFDGDLLITSSVTGNLNMLNGYEQHGNNKKSNTNQTTSGAVQCNACFSSSLD